ncbi:MAG: YbhB/YbcL family Raf kinase inhibitor-like protein [Acidimicrobiaceae bacterium]|nr:YbhB/YbcL family Raf kinase inhibitor-like protein [Acidimicrobiaceae bacterium]
MTLLGTLLKNRRAGDSQSAWNLENLQCEELLRVTSGCFAEGGPIPLEHAGRRVGGKNLSPDLTWSAPAHATTRLLLVVEDLDVPIFKPAVHCLALIDTSQLARANHLPLGALAAKEPGTGVRILRSTVTRGYHGPEPIKGHGPHHYTFELFALSGTLITDGHEAKLERTRPRDVLAALVAPVTARGRLTGTYER